MQRNCFSSMTHFLTEPGRNVYDKSTTTLCIIWREYLETFDDPSFMKPKKKGRFNRSYLDRFLEAESIDTLLLNTDGFIFYRGIKMNWN